MSHCPIMLALPGVPTIVQLCDEAPAPLGERVLAQLQGQGVSKFILITGRRERKPWLEQLLNVLSPAARLTLTECSGAAQHAIEALLGKTRDVHFDAVIAIGGGSVIDAAKVVRAARRATSIDEILTTPPGAGGQPILVAIPTTSGSGSEVTPYATIWDTTGGKKRSLQRPEVFPDFAFVNPQLFDTVAHSTRASNFFDAVSHSLDSLLSPRSTAESTDCALAALGRLSTIARPVLSGRKLESSDRLLQVEATLFAAAAIATTRSGLIHAISYPLTLRYGLSHGHACGVAIEHSLRFIETIDSSCCSDPRGVVHVRATFATLKALLKTSDPPTHFANWLVRSGLNWCPSVPGATEIKELATSVAGSDRAGNCPRTLGEPELCELLAELFTANARYLSVLSAMGSK